MGVSLLLASRFLLLMEWCWWGGSRHSASSYFGWMSFLKVPDGPAQGIGTISRNFKMCLGSSTLYIAAVQGCLLYVMGSSSSSKPGRACQAEVWSPFMAWTLSICSTNPGYDLKANSVKHQPQEGNYQHLVHQCRGKGHKESFHPGV